MGTIVWYSTLLLGWFASASNRDLQRLLRRKQPDEEGTATIQQKIDPLKTQEENIVEKEREKNGNIKTNIKC